MKDLIVANITIRQDAEGRYCLNDLHKASGNHVKNRPSEWLKTKQAKELVALMENESKEGIPSLPIASQFGGTMEKRGTFIVRELVYAYAMWISPEFHIRVIRTYDALMMERANELSRMETQHENYWFNRCPHWRAIKQYALEGYPYKMIAKAVKKSASTVARAIRSMVKVGIINPRKLEMYQIGQAARVARKLQDGWGESQYPLRLDFHY